jgi:hypothetical protein
MRARRRELDGKPQLRLTLAAAVRPLLGTQLFVGRQSSIAYFYEAGLNNSGRLR